MKSAAHQYEDKLLEFAYGELPQHEADAVDAHVRGCTRCSQSLSEIRGVRATMAQLPMATAPDAGLESLMAYAEQAAKRNSAPAPSIWKRFLMPLASVMAMVTVGVVGFRASKEFDTSPASAAADTTMEERAKNQPRKEAALSPAPPADIAGALQQENEGKDGKAAPIVAAVSPTPAEAPATEEAPADYGRQLDDAKTNKKEVKLDTADLREGGKRGDVWAPEPKAAPQSVTRRSPKQPSKPAPVGNDEQVAGYRDNDYSNAAARGGITKAKDSAPAPPPAAKVVQDNFSDVSQRGAQPSEKPAETLAAQDKSPGYGLGSADWKSAPQGVVATKPSPGPAKETQEKEEAKKQRAKSEEVVQPGPAPVVASPSTPVPSSSAPLSLSKKPKGGYGQQAQLGGSGSLGLENDEVAVQETDRLSANRDAKVLELERGKGRTQSLESARVASSRGDRVSEIRLLAQVLSDGATGYERVEALKRICDAYEDLGEPERADPFCDQLVSEFPNTAAAKAVSDRRKQVQRAPPAPAPKAAAPNRERKATEQKAIDSATSY